MGLILLASYPKSGNTWMRALLTNYHSGQDMPADINDLVAPPLLGMRALLEEIFGLDTGLLSLDEIERYRSHACRIVADESPDGTFVKVHDAYGHAGSGLPLFPADAIDRVVYIVRNPIDVAPAFAYHLDKTIRHVVERMNAPDMTLFGDMDKGWGQVPQRLGTWHGHVAGWLDQTDIPVELVRYEDLVADPAAAVARVLSATGETVDASRADFAVRASSIETLRRLEGTTGFREKNPAAASFFGRRAAGTDPVISTSLRAEIIRNHGSMMRRLGYSTSDC